MEDRIGYESAETSLIRNQRITSPLQNVVRREIKHYLPNCRQGHRVLLSSDAATVQSKKYPLWDCVTKSKVLSGKN